MKIAFATLRGGLDDSITASFGRAPFFTIVDGDKVEIVENPGASAARGAGVLAVNFLKERGVQMVVAGRFGPNAAMALERAGIKAVERQGIVREVLQTL